MGKVARKLKRLLPNLKENVLLKDYTTFKIGGPTKYFFVAKTKEDLIGAIKMAKELDLPFFVLGGGSNVLVSDEGYKGLVINFQFQPYGESLASLDPAIFNFQNSKIVAGAGTPLALLVSKAIENGLTGLEWAAGIPGTVGGAIYGNAGAFGKSIGDVIKEVEVFDLKSEKIKIFKNKDCKFGYRETIFKKKKNQSDLIILSAEIQLKKGKKAEIRKKMKEYLEHRKKTQPLNFPSIGSIFKNPPLANLPKSATNSTNKIISDIGEGLVDIRDNKIPAGLLVEKCDLKGKQIGKAQISKKHANFIVNLDGAQARDVKKLIDLAKEKVKQNFEIELEEEIQYLGFKIKKEIGTVEKYFKQG